MNDERKTSDKNLISLHGTCRRLVESKSMAERRFIFMFRFFCSCVVILAMCATSYGYLHASEDPYPNIEIPVFTGAFNKHLHLDENNRIKSLTYQANVEYPANSLVHFYEEYLNNKGFKQGNMEEPEWQLFVDGTVKGSPTVRQLFFVRQNIDAALEALVVLSYKNFGEGWSDELQVTCQLQPIIDTSKLEEFMEKLMLTDRNAYVQLLQLLDSYRSEDGDVDLEKAVHDNQDNEYLIKYKQLIDELVR